MSFLLDQSTDARLIAHLTEQGHDATRIAKGYPHGLPDTQVLTIARAEGRILITDDPDFGELVFRLGQTHPGVIFLRLGPHANLAFRIVRLDHVLTHYADQLDQFIVVTSRAARVRRR
jgi:predicted nuclease of predicted toxin-antitoxin system